MTRRPRRPSTGTCRWRTTLAVTRSRTSSSSRRGSSMATVVLDPRLAPGADLADPQRRGVAVPVGGLDLLPRDPPVADVERVAGAGDDRAVGRLGPGQHRLPRGDVDRGPGTSSHEAPIRGRAACGGAARGRPARRTSGCTRSAARPGWCAAAATSGRRSGAGGELLQAVDVERDVGRRRAPRVSSGSTASALIAEETAGSVGRVAQPAWPSRRRRRRRPGRRRRRPAPRPRGRSGG